jgi:3-hydroxy-9,10-secoandrosta-1,3,5(10)-triene-9,17-dione monooxygenase reductase component
MDDTVFREVLGRFPTGVTVVVSVHGGQPTGLLIGSFFVVSLDPPLVGFCAGKTSSSWVGYTRRRRLLRERAQG